MVIHSHFSSDRLTRVTFGRITAWGFVTHGVSCLPRFWYGSISPWKRQRRCQVLCDEKEPVKAPKSKNQNRHLEVTVKVLAFFLTSMCRRWWLGVLKARPR